jgi:glucokinase
LKKAVVGIDIGGTNTKFGIVNNSGKILASGNIRTDSFTDFGSFIGTLVSSVTEIYNPLMHEYEITGYGTGAPNANFFKGIIEEAPNLKWKGIINYNKTLTKLTGKPSFITNDANAAAIGEKLFGKAKDLTDFVVLTLGTGLGCGIFSNGKLLYGSTGHAGELGHIIVKENGRQCGCGRRGCLETYASATGITKTVIELRSSYLDSILYDTEIKQLNSKLIYEAALKGDSLALLSFELTGEILGIALANTAAVLSPQAIFLLGGLANAGDFIFKPVVKYFEENLLIVFKNSVKIIPSGLEHDKAAILGAAALCWDELYTQVDRSNK